MQERIGARDTSKKDKYVLNGDPVKVQLLFTGIPDGKIAFLFLILS
jgi:hypothetical protein